MGKRTSLEYNEDEDNLLLASTLSPTVRVAVDALAHALADEYALDEDGEAFTLWICPTEEGGEAEIVALYPPDEDDDEDETDDDTDDEEGETEEDEDEEDEDDEDNEQAE